MNRHQTELLARTETEREAKEVAKILWQWQAQIQLSAQHPTLVLIAWALLGWMLVIAGTFVLPFAASFRASALVILGGLSTALILGVFIKNWQATQSRRHRQRLQQQFSAFCQPIEWNVDGVRSALETAMAAMAAAQSQRDTLVRLQSRLEMLGEINEIAELDQFRQELARQTGLQLNDHDGYDLAGILANLNRLDEAEQRCQEMQSRLALTETQLQEARSDLLNSLRSQNIPAEISSWEVAEVWLSHIDALRHAYATQARISAEAKHVQEILLQQQAQLTAIYSQYGFAETDDPFAQLPTFRQWLQATENLRTANARCQSQENRLSVLLDACGIPTAHLDDTTQTLTNRLTELQNRRQPQQEWQNHHETIIRLHDKLNRIDIADFEPLRQHYNVHPDLPETELESLQQRLQQQTEREDTVREKLSRLEAEVAQATRGETMADLNCKLHDSINQTGQWLQTRTDNTATRLVCNFLQDKIKNEATPAIVREANLLIDQLSTGRYGDILVENRSAGQTLSLLDRSDGHRKTFAELSAGIRVHLGIAVRLACVQAAEENSGCQFPLFLDEIMAVSDTATARIIADALLNIALDRQIILLTCQEDDIHLLEEQAGRTLPKIRLAAFPMEYTPPQPTPQLSLPLLEIHHLDGAIPLRTALRLWPATLLKQILPELPPDCETVGVAVTRLTGPERSRAEQILDAAEVARQMLAPLTLTPDEIPADCSWCTDAFRQEVLEALQTARGNPFLFLELLAQIKKYGKRTETCREWLETNNRLNSPPTQLQVWQVVYNAMRGNDAERPLIAKKITELFLPETTLPLVARA